MRRFLGIAAVGALTASGLALTSPAGAVAPPATLADQARGTGFGLGAHAYGTKIDRNPVLASGPTANSIIGCTTRAGLDRHNYAASVDSAPLLKANEVKSYNFTRQSNGVVSVTSRNTITRGSLMGGDVRFHGLSSQSKTWHDTTGFHNKVTMHLAGLSIGGEPVNLTGNTQTIPVGAAKLTVFQRNAQKSATQASARGIVLELVLADGTRVWVGYSHSVMRARVFGPLGGSTWGTRVDVGGTVKSGKTAFQVMPCQGTGGEIVANPTADVTVPDILSAQGVATHKWGIQKPLLQKGYTQAEIADAQVLGATGLVLKGIVSRANVTRDNGTLTRNAKGTRLLSATLAGQPIRGLLTPGEPVNLLGFGTVTFKKVTKINNGIDVVAVDVVLLDNTHIELGHSIMKIKPS